MSLLIGIAVVALLGTVYVLHEARVESQRRHIRRMIQWIAVDCPPDTDDRLSDREHAA